MTGPVDPQAPDTPTFGQPPAYGAAPPPGYGQPQYGQPQYGQPAYPQQAYGSRGRATPGVAGLILTGLGAILLIVAGTALNWFKGGGSSKLSDIRQVISNESSVNAITKAYFTWLIWALIAVGVIAAIAANVPSPAATGMKVLGALVGFAAIILTFLAIRIGQGFPYSQVLKQTRTGFYIASIGFLLVAIGALVGPRRNRT
ncbi:MAG: hypothetical protein ABI368_09420 [Jatrophihabitantaceae bacterium]